MKQTYEFLQNLAENNNREWFAENKHIYKEVQGKFHALAQQLIDAVSLWDPDIAASNLTVKDCTYRICRDTRFSRSKEPYKIHMGIFICKRGKKSPYAGSYFHLEPEYFLPDNPLHTVYCKTPLSLEYIFADNLARRISEDFRKTADFVHKINMAVDYALENM